MSGGPAELESELHIVGIFADGANAGIGVAAEAAVDILILRGSQHPVRRANRLQCKITRRRQTLLSQAGIFRGKAVDYIRVAGSSQHVPGLFNRA